MDERPSSMQFYPMRHGPNGPMVIFMAINYVLTIQGVGIMVIIISMAILLFHVALF
jgi:hypothetical protein